VVDANADQSEVDVVNHPLPGARIFDPEIVGEIPRAL
jgi:hypothetical protein